MGARGRMKAYGGGGDHVGSRVEQDLTFQEALVGLLCFEARKVLLRAGTVLMLEDQFLPWWIFGGGFSVAGSVIIMPRDC